MPFVVVIDSTCSGSVRDAASAALRPLCEAGAASRIVSEGSWAVAATTAWLSGGHTTDSSSGVSAGADRVVLLDGFITDGPGTVDEIAGLIDRAGPTALESLDGSYVLAVLEPGARRAVVLTDRAGSRPIYAAWNSDRLLIAPELKCFRADAVLRGDLCPAGVLSLLFNSYFFDEVTYWENVRALGPARRLSVEDGRVRVDRYWAPSFGRRHPPGAAEQADTVQCVIARFVERFRRPVLGLSGGVDSRLILAAARRAGFALPTVTWTYADRDSPESDMAVARRVAQRAGIEHEEQRLSWSVLADEAEPLVDASDGVVGHLGGFADRRRLAEDLGRRYDAILLGDECYRGEGAVRDNAEAIEAIGVQLLRHGAAVRLARFFMQPDAALPAERDYRERLERLVAEAGPQATPQDLHDRLYWQVRLPRLLTGPKALWRRYLDAVSPLLAAPLIELAAATPPEQRVHKRGLRAALDHCSPELAALPYAGESGRIKWRRILHEAGRFQRYLAETLLDPLPAFDRWFDRKAIELACRAALAERPPRIASNDGMLRRARRRANGLLVRPILRPPVLLGLLTIKLWMRKNA